jgi:hypothetical protein
MRTMIALGAVLVAGVSAQAASAHQTPVGG